MASTADHFNRTTEIQPQQTKKLRAVRCADAGQQMQKRTGEARTRSGVGLECTGRLECDSVNSDVWR